MPSEPLPTGPNITGNATFNQTTIVANTTQNTSQVTQHGVTFSNFTIFLNDVTLPLGGGQPPCGAFEIDAKNGNKLLEFQLCQGNQYRWVDPTGRAWRIVAYSIVQGYTKQTAYADLAVFG